MADLNLSARAYDRILKVARTIADLAVGKNPERPHFRSNPIPLAGPPVVGVTQIRESRGNPGNANCWRIPKGGVFLGVMIDYDCAQGFAR